MPFDDFGLDDTIRLGAEMMCREYELTMRYGNSVALSLVQALTGPLEVRQSFLGGSMSRQTWGHPRSELDLFVVLDDIDREFLASPPTVIFDHIADLIRGSHPIKRRKKSRRVALEIGDFTNGRYAVMGSVVILPAFRADRGLMIPDQWLDEWICVDPDGFDMLAEKADSRVGNWRELVRIVKAWNNRDGKNEPIVKPGLLIELMTMRLIDEVAGLDLTMQLIALFELMFKRFDQEWPDPAGLAPPLGSYLAKSRQRYAKDHLQHTWLTLASAKRADNRGDLKEAKRLARSALGKMVSIAPRDEDGMLIPINAFGTCR